MNILYFLRHHGYLKNYESTLRLLLERGHRVRIVFDRQKPVPLADRLAADYPTFSYEFKPKLPANEWDRLSRDIRNAGDYLRYLDPVYRDSAKLRQRVEKRVSPELRRFFAHPLARCRPALRLATDVLRLLHRSLPVSERVCQFIRDRQPDLVLVTPLVELESPQVEYIRGAQALGVPTALCVNSWDNLTNKGLIWATPERILVWNRFQRTEAVRLHGVPSARVEVTGAQAYDLWFEQRPSTSRQEFMERVGLAPDRPYLLYVCSSEFIAPRERPFVERWIEVIREAEDPALRSAGILIRPHAGHAEQWRGFDASRYLNAAVWPPLGASPITDESKADYYDSMYHSAAVLGINTSAMIEAGIVGRPVHTILAPEFAEGQRGTLHFRYLLRAQGGLLHVSRELPEHLRQLAAALAHPARRDEKARRFVGGFVRPYGLATPATPILADALEWAGGSGPTRPRRTPPWLLPLRFALLRGARTRRAPCGEALHRIWNNRIRGFGSVPERDPTAGGGPSRLDRPMAARTEPNKGGAPGERAAKLEMAKAKPAKAKPTKAKLTKVKTTKVKTAKAKAGVSVGAP